MIKAKLYRQSKSAMQSGLGNTQHWVVDFPHRQNYVEPLMGWVGCQNTAYQKKLFFPTKDQALQYLKAHGIPFDFIKPQETPIRPKTYGTTFQANRVLK